jgi:hypothetical protein
MRLGRLVGAAIATALIAGCGGSSAGGGVTEIGSATMTVGTTHSATTPTRVTTSKLDSGPEPSLLAFARCMRAHGVPNFPDPRSPGQLPRPKVTEPAPSGGFTANPDAPAYLAASNDCKSLADATPVSQVMRNQTGIAQLKFAVCMRSDGVPNYPDPTATGEIGDDGSISGVDPSAPAVLSAERKCFKLIPRPTMPTGGPPGSS